MPNKPPPVLLVPPPPNAEPVPKPRLQEVARQRDWFFVAGPCHPLSSSQVSLIIEGIRRWVGHGTVKVEVLKPRDCLARVSSPSRVDVRSTGLFVETGWHPGQGSRYKQRGEGQDKRSQREQERPTSTSVGAPEARGAEARTLIVLAKSSSTGT